jgi:hypothetical protein
VIEARCPVGWRGEQVDGPQCDKPVDGRPDGACCVHCVVAFEACAEQYACANGRTALAPDVATTESSRWLATASVENTASSCFKPSSPAAADPLLLKPDSGLREPERWVIRGGKCHRLLGVTAASE